MIIIPACCFSSNYMHFVYIIIVILSISVVIDFIHCERVTMHTKFNIEVFLSQ